MIPSYNHQSINPLLYAQPSGSFPSVLSQVAMMRCGNISRSCFLSCDERKAVRKLTCGQTTRKLQQNGVAVLLSPFSKCKPIFSTHNLSSPELRIIAPALQGRARQVGHQDRGFRQRPVDGALPRQGLPGRGVQTAHARVVHHLAVEPSSSGLFCQKNV